MVSSGFVQSSGYYSWQTEVKEAETKIRTESNWAKGLAFQRKKKVSDFQKERNSGRPKGLPYISPSDVVTPFSRSLIPLLRDISVYLSVVLYSFLRNSVFVHFDHKGLVSLICVVRNYSPIPESYSLLPLDSHYIRISNTHLIKHFVSRVVRNSFHSLLSY